MSDDLINLEVNGVPLKARKGQTIIQVTDAADIYIPRFCYHAKLSIPANCRMCLVEVERAPKPLPACATPVMEGMKVFTRSPKAVAAQRATMEFLLINHPLDCPICDQGGECELQDLAMGYGRDISRFTERKRVVRDKSLGPLVSTDMTRCIQCTRCVRFGLEVQGYPQLGTTQRGEHMLVETYVEQSLDHELSANIIDLCPVGALNNKPFRYHARAWEMLQHPLVSPHDGFGTNLYAHTLRGRLMRVVPRANEAVNETWIADRDRFGFEGMYCEERIERPLVRRGDALEPTDWDGALAAAAAALREVAAGRGAEQIGCLSSPNATLEEMYLLARIARALGSPHLDHRLRQLDVRGQESEEAYPSIGLPIGALESLESVLVVGSNLRAEMPLLAHRLRKTALRGAQVAFLNPRRFDYFFPVAAYGVAADLPAELERLCALAEGATASPGEHAALLAALRGQAPRALILGTLAQRHPAYGDIKRLARRLAAATQASLGTIVEGANAAGAYLAGVVPHRLPGGVAAPRVGLGARAMLEAKLAAYVLLGGIDPTQDLAGPVGALAGAERVIAITSHLSPGLREVADIVLPIGTFAETAGTFVSAEGRWQSWAAAASLLGESRPGWKVLRVLADLLGLQGLDFVSCEQVREALERECGGRAAPIAEARVPSGDGATLAGAPPSAPWVDIPAYQIDVLVRGSESLAKTNDGQLLRTVL